MRVLLDTNILMWAHRNRRRLSVEVIDLLQSPLNTVYFSAVSIWEDPLTLLRVARESGFIELPVKSEAVQLWRTCRFTIATPSTACLSPKL